MFAQHCVKRGALPRFPMARTRLDFDQAIVATAADGTFTAHILQGGDAPS